MAYFKPYIDESGLHIPTFRDILDDLIASMKEIYGNDIYLENDSADYQLLSIFALKQADTLQAIAEAYNSRSPVTAIGAALDAVVKLNGILRKPQSYSTCLVRLKGTPNTIINDGVCEDTSGIKWNLPGFCIIGDDGYAQYTATCHEPGAIPVAEGEINKITTPTAGWISVVNLTAAALGKPKETDADLRIRQSDSVSLPGLTLLESTKSAIATILNVKRYAVYENDSNFTSDEGFPPHSITCVVEGGDEQDIAEQIFNHKGVGCYTHGDVVVKYVDSTDYMNNIRFFRPVYRDLWINVKIKKYPGYVSSVVNDIKEALQKYLEQMVISSDISLSMLAAIAGSCNPQILHPIFGLAEIKIGLDQDSLAASDIEMSYKEIPTTDITKINVEVLP